MNDMTNPSAEESTRISVPLKPPVRTIDGHLEEVINIHKRLKAPDYVIIENLWGIIQHRMTGRSDYRYNPYLVFSRDIKKTGIDPDISVEKELYNKTFFELAKTTRPSDIINKLLFYGKTGLASATPIEACQKIELLPYRDEFREKILMDLFSSVSLNSIRRYSLKTLWYIHRTPLQDIPGYDDMFCKDVIFCINRTHLPFVFPCIVSEFHVYSSAYKADTYDLSDKEEQKFWQQIWIILNYLSRRFGIINPIQVQQPESKQMPTGAQSVRNMIVTRSFSKKQTQAIWKYIEEKDKNGYLYKRDSLRILIAIRFMTGLPLSEVLALEWGHISVSSEYGTHLLYISGKMDVYGNRLNYSDFDPDRARIIPIPEQLFVILHNRRTYLKQQYPFASLDEVPIMIDREPRSKNRKQFMRMSVESATNEFRKAKEKVSNGKRIIELESLGIETDYANFGGDLFNKNHEHYALKYGCNPGSLRYMYGFKPTSTVELYYIDYENEAILNQTAETLSRWICSLKSTEKEYSSTESLTVQGIYSDHIRLPDRTATIRLTTEASDSNNEDEVYLSINSAHSAKVSIR